MSKAPRAAFSYYGGKQRMAAAHIVPLLPPHTVYVETHAGGLAVLFAKGKQSTGNGHDYREVVNDTDSRIINFYRVMQDSGQSAELLERLRWTLYSREEHARAIALVKSGDGSAVDQAWAWYVNIQQSFANELNRGWRTGVVGCNLAQTWVNHKARLPQIRDRLRAVHIEHLDQCAVIAKWASPQTCFYVDPPYVGANQGHYAGYTQADFEALLAALDASGGSVVLSCYDNPALDQYPHWERYAFTAVSSASGQGQTGAGRDKTRAATAAEQGDRRRTERVYVVDRSASMRQTCQEAAQRLSQGTLWEIMGGQR